jgi:hypothetical protein
MSPNVIEMGSAGNAFLKMASNSNVRHKPCKKDRIMNNELGRT